MREQAYRWALWITVGAFIALTHALDQWGAGSVRDWVFGQTGAAWVQAVGSIAAIAGAFAIASFQAKKQHRSAHALLSHQQLQAVRTLRRLTEAAAGGMRFAVVQLDSIKALEAAAEQGFKLNFGGMADIQESLREMPVYQVDAEGARLCFMARMTIGRFIRGGEVALETYRTMNAAALDEFLKGFAACLDDMDECVAGMQALIGRLEAEVDA
jgi:hypothetical protein